MLWQKFNNNRLFHMDKSARVLYLERFYNAIKSWLCQEKCASYFLTYTLYFTSSYLAFRSEKPCYSDSLFLTMEREPITSNAIKMLFQRLKISSGISLLYPHLLRHTFATNYIIRAVILKYSGSYSVIVLSQSLKYIFIWLHKCN